MTDEGAPVEEVITARVESATATQTAEAAAEVAQDATETADAAAEVAEEAERIAREAREEGWDKVGRDEMREIVRSEIDEREALIRDELLAQVQERLDELMATVTPPAQAEGIEVVPTTEVTTEGVAEGRTEIEPQTLSPRKPGFFSLRSYR